jgi:hypothetical protein
VKGAATTRRLAMAGAALAALAACHHERATAPQRAPARKGSDLQTVEVEPPPDAKVDVTQDKQEHRRAETFAGVLPSGFPSALPLPPQASLVDQGGSRGSAWVELLVPRRPAAVRDPYIQQLRSAGWQVKATGTDAWSVQRGGRTVRLQLRAQGPSTRLRLGY